MNIEHRIQSGMNEIELRNFGQAKSIFSEIVKANPQQSDAWFYLGYSKLFYSIDHPFEDSNIKFLVAAIFRCFYRGLESIQDENERINLEVGTVNNIAVCLNDLRELKKNYSHDARSKATQVDTNSIWRTGLQIFAVFNTNKSLSSAIAINNSIERNYQKSRELHYIASQSAGLSSFCAEMIAELKSATYGFIDKFSYDFSEDEVTNLKISLLEEHEKKNFVKKIQEKSKGAIIQYLSGVIRDSLTSNQEYQKFLLEAQKLLKNGKCRKAISNAKKAYDIYNDIQFRLLNEVELSTDIPNAILDNVISTARNRIAVKIITLFILISILWAVFYLAIRYNYIHITLGR